MYNMSYMLCLFSDYRNQEPHTKSWTIGQLYEHHFNSSSFQPHLDGVEDFDRESDDSDVVLDPLLVHLHLLLRPGRLMVTELVEQVPIIQDATSEPLVLIRDQCHWNRQREQEQKKNDHPGSKEEPLRKTIGRARFIAFKEILAHICSISSFFPHYSFGMDPQELGYGHV